MIQPGSMLRIPYAWPLRFAASFGFLAVGVAACVTVNVYFPAPEVRAAAEEIVEETWGDGREAGDADLSAVGRRPSLSSPGLAFLAPGVAWAAADVDVSTVAIRALRNAMKGRAIELKPHMVAGRLGITRDGDLAERDLSDLPLRMRADLRRQIDAENRDRAALYAEIAAANELSGASHLEEIRRIFAETWLARAGEGWWVQDAEGTWRMR